MKKKSNNSFSALRTKPVAELAKQRRSVMFHPNKANLFENEQRFTVIKMENLQGHRK